MATQILTIGDCHLNALDKYWEDGTTKQITVLRKLFEVAASRGIAHVVLLGDIGHKPVLSPTTILPLLSLFLAYPNLKFYILVGNHDLHHQHGHSLWLISALKKRGLVTNVRVFSKPTYSKIGPIPCAFLPYPERTLAPDKDPEKYLAFAHHELRGAFRDNGHPVPDSAGGSKTGFWVCGHLHSPQVIDKRVFYPGTPYQTKFDEDVAKGFAILDVRCLRTGHVRVTYDWFELRPDFKLINQYVHTAQDLASLSDSDDVRYKIWVQNAKLEVPENFMLAHPNVINLVTLAKTPLEKSDTVIDNSDILDYCWSDLLSDYLRDTGVHQQQIDRAVVLLEHVLAKINLKRK